jgi:hypothetical protein
MKSKTNFKLPLNDFEKANLKRNKVKTAHILNYASDELEVLLNSNLKDQKKFMLLPNFKPFLQLDLSLYKRNAGCSAKFEYFGIL